MLSECLVAWRIFSTAVLVSSVVRSEVTAKSRPCHKTLVATWAVADVVSNGGMGTLQMVVKVRGTKECLVAALMSTSEEPFIIVRSDVFLQSSRTVVCLVTTLEGTAMCLEFGRVTGRGGREWCCWSFMYIVTRGTRCSRRRILSVGMIFFIDWVFVVIISSW